MASFQYLANFSKSNFQKNSSSDNFVHFKKSSSWSFLALEIFFPVLTKKKKKILSPVESKKTEIMGSKGIPVCSDDSDQKRDLEVFLGT